MNIVKLVVATIVLTVSSSAFALDGAALIGKWQLVERAKGIDGKPCPFVGEKIQFTADGKMISANMPFPFRYKVNPTKEETAGAVVRNPELEGMDIMLAMAGNASDDWSKAQIVYGVKLKDKQLTMIVSGYTPSLYKKLK